MSIDGRNGIMISRNRDGTPVETYDGEGKIIDLLYGSAAGRLLLRFLISPAVSKTAGLFLDCPLSTGLVRPFIRKNHLNLADYPERSYRSFNDFFTRTILPGRRPMALDASKLISPCDGKATVFSLREDSHFTIKGCDYTLSTLLQNEELCRAYCGGWGILLRLTVDDYHRYIYPVSGAACAPHHISGVFHTVNPRAAAARAIYRENTREYTLIKTAQFGTVLMMEIGAMLVGRIKNPQSAAAVERGAEKGYFEFGGSSIMLLLEKGHFDPDADLIAHSANGEETVVKQGESIGQLK